MVGPWGWASKMLRDDLLISTAALLGHDFSPTWWPESIGRSPYPYRHFVSKAEYAEQWLGNRRIRITPTLNIEKG